MNVVTSEAPLSEKFIRSLQIVLNEKTKSRITVNGKFSVETTSALKKFQDMNDLSMTGRYDKETEEILQDAIDIKFLTPLDYEQAALTMNCSLPTMQTVVEMQCWSEGFVSNGKVFVTFYRDRFYKELSKKKSHAEILKLYVKDPVTVNSAPGGHRQGVSEYERFLIAASIDPNAAMLSSEWGMFQIAGTKYSTCGYTNVAAFVSDMQHSERRQLEAFCKILKKNVPAHEALRKPNWMAFSQAYNTGECFASASAHLIQSTRMADAYVKHVDAAKEKA